MNVFTGIMLVFAIIGFADKIFSLRWGLTESFDKGLMTMGTMVIPVVGVCAIGVEFIIRHIEAIGSMSDVMFFDPTMIVGILLAPDLGGYFISEAITDSPDMLIMNGVVLGTLLGQAICFQLPVFLAAVDKVHRPVMLKGFLVGITMIPAGMVAAELILRMNVADFLKQFVPILVLCLLVALGLYKIPDAMVKGFMVVGRVIQIATNLMFAWAVLGVFIPQMSYADVSSVEGALMIIFKSAIIIAGALVMSELILKVFRRQIESVATMLLFDRMDDKGRKLNCAFSISGAYVIGGSMAFLSAVSSGYVVLIFFVCKLVSGILSLYIMHRMESKNG